MKTISISVGCFNERENIRELYARCLAALSKFPEYDYEFVIEDNCSTDGTQKVLRELTTEDPRFKVIFNSGNFGAVRSTYNAFMNTSGDAVVWICADLQEPPETIVEFIRKWQEGYEIVAGVRTGTKSSPTLEFFRRMYYWILAKTSDGAPIIPKFTGFGLYDRRVLDALRKYHEPYPYFRGLVCEVGFKATTVPYVQAERKFGKSKFNFIRLYDFAMTGFVNHTKVPLRLAVFFGFAIGLMSFLVSIAYLILKLVFWDTFSFGIAPIIIAQFFFASVQLIFIGIIGEYVGAVWTQVKNKPLVIESERLNF